MPSNRVSINDQEHLSWEVPDSKLEAVITVLDAVSGRVVLDERQDALEGARVAHDLALSTRVDDVKVEIDEGGNVVREAKTKKGGVNGPPTTPPPPPPKGQGGHQSSGPE